MYPPQARNTISRDRLERGDFSLDQAKDHLVALARDLDANTRLQRLCNYDPYRTMVNSGRAWKDYTAHHDVATIRQISKSNLTNVREFFTKFLVNVWQDQRVQQLFIAIRDLEYTLAHNTKPEYAAKIMESRAIHSKTELERRGKADIVGGTGQGINPNTEYLANEDFAFFRLWKGKAAAESRFGDVCIVFRADELFEVGWISLHDMLKPLGPASMQWFPDFDGEGRLLRDQKNRALRQSTEVSYKEGYAITHNYQETGHSRTLHRVEEVFYGPDIREGIAFSVLMELACMGEKALFTACRQAGNLDALFNLVFNLFRPEVKIPKHYLFQRGDILATHVKAKL